MSPPPARCPARRSRSLRRGGSVLVWMIATLTPLMGICTLAVDWGHTQLVKTEMQNSADAIAVGVMSAYITAGWTAANVAAATIPSENVVDKGSGVTPTVIVVGGSWDYTNRVFLANNFAGTPAVRVTITRTKANNNAVRLAWGGLIGINTVDVHVSSVAAQDGGDTTPVTVPSTANLYLSGMPAGTTTIWGDSASNAAPYQVPSIPVTPGQWISITNPTGSTSILPGYVPYVGASGLSILPLHHGQNYNSNPNNPGPENGIADAVIPASAVTGLFLTDDPPDASAAPATVDWTPPAQYDQPAYGSLNVQQPFLIGNGMTSGGTVKKFRVPPGATRMYLSVWDGVQQSNNGGSISATITCKLYARLVK